MQPIAKPKHMAIQYLHGVRQQDTEQEETGQRTQKDGGSEGGWGGRHAIKPGFGAGGVHRGAWFWISMELSLMMSLTFTINAPQHLKLSTSN